MHPSNFVLFGGNFFSRLLVQVDAAGIPAQIRFHLVFLKGVMTHMNHRFSSLALASLLTAGLLTGCGSSTPPSTPSPDPSTPVVSGYPRAAPQREPPPLGDSRAGGHSLRPQRRAFFQAHGQAQRTAQRQANRKADGQAHADAGPGRFRGGRRVE